MRKDAKIGLGIPGALVLGVAVWYIGWGCHKPAVAPPEVTQDTSVGTGVNEVMETAAAPGEPSGYSPQLAAATASAPATAPTAGLSFPGERLARAPGGAAGLSIPPALPGGEGAAGMGPPGVGTEGTYVVKTGDNYWTIAKRELGNANLHVLIEKANPGVAPNRLAPGMTIKLPAKPAPVPPRVAGIDSGLPALAAGAGAPEGAAGAIEAQGRRIYVVKAGDNGFWGVSQAVFGDGRYWQVIERANPNVKATALRIGQRLIIPDKPAGAPGPGATHTLAEHAERPSAVAPAARVGTGAPARTRLPDGRVFD